jgi:hypothetical protein
VQITANTPTPYIYRGWQNLGSAKMARPFCNNVKDTIFEVFDGLFKGRFELRGVAGYFD